MKVKIKHVASQSLKILLCLVILFAFMFVQPKENLQKADAALPAVLVAVLGSVVLDVAIDMGIDFIDKKAGQEWSKKLVGNLWNKYGQKISDLKPTKTNAGKWTLNVGKSLLALIVDEITDSVKDIPEKEKVREENNKKLEHVYESDTDVSTDPFYKTSIRVKVQPQSTNAEDAQAYAMFLKYSVLTITPKPYEQKTEVQICMGSECYSNIYSGDRYVVLDVGDYYNTATLKSISIYDSSSESSYPTMGTGHFANSKFAKYVDLFETYKKKLEEANKKIYEFGGVLVTDGFDSYVDLPDDVVLTDDQLGKIDYSKMPTVLQNDRDFEFEIGDSTVIDADYEVINEGDSFDWELIEQDVVNQGDNIYKDFELDYNPVTNNNYTLTKEQQDDINNNIIINIDNDVDSSPGKVDVDVDVEGFMYCVDKATSGVVPCKEIEAIDGGLLAYIGNAYDYAVNAVKSGVDGIATITAGATGLIALYSHIFSWLPSEVTVILTSGLLLMIGLRVFRK